MVDDACPEGSGEIVSEKYSNDRKIEVVRRATNGGVGAAMKTGFDWALERDFDILIKLDADDQMDVGRIPEMMTQILTGKADFVKGNRFDSVRDIEAMPFLRILGNAALSLISKGSTGLWTINDPTNGFFAISRPALIAAQHAKLSNGYFFESDLLFRLGVANCSVQEVSMPAIYKGENSSLRISRVLLTFPLLHLRNTFKRMAYAYFVREWSLGTLNLLGSLLMGILAILLGIDVLRVIGSTGNPVTAGQAVGVSMSAILAFQLLLAFLSYDVQMQRRDGARFDLD